jgi:hypothetical protein
MSEVREPGGQADATRAESDPVDERVSGVPGAEVPGAGRDGQTAAAEAAGDDDPAAQDDAATGGAEPGVVDRLAFWVSWLELAQQAQPETLGQYLTNLVAEKRAFDDASDTWLLACGVIAVMAALGRTKPGEIGFHQQQAALAMVQARHWLGWPLGTR